MEHRKEIILLFENKILNRSFLIETTTENSNFCFTVKTIKNYDSTQASNIYLREEQVIRVIEALQAELADRILLKE